MHGMKSEMEKDDWLFSIVLYIDKINSKLYVESTYYTFLLT